MSGLKIVCLCGSTRFRETFHDENRRLTLEGNIVLAPGYFRGDHSISEDEKANLDELHLRKIDLADEVRIVNPGGYVGDSTKAEIEYSLNNWKLVTFMEHHKRYTQGCCAACLYVGFADVGGGHAVGEFLARGWKSIPRRTDASGGFWLCSACAEMPETEVEFLIFAKSDAGNLGSSKSGKGRG